jgi:hypothetical protein
VALPIFDPGTYSGSSRLIDWLMATLGAESQYPSGAGFSPSPMDANARDRRLREGGLTIILLTK